MSIQKQIALEIAQRRQTCGLIINEDQYAALRLQGKTIPDIETLEKSLAHEIEAQKSVFFIPSLWIKYRTEGIEPEEIEYDWVHATH